ncbi:Putative Holin-X, holin superfamily III [Geodermatophilus telluris]|uniref:Putative Holin-X, holin superfamily III n=1 Tax=Geodermatophilus telluris TaxID=1190417 RepID=A0A1G6MT20_9ACTN|nr:phage holin family protein [Geodermatophilus telluris]SDC58384.1 Putative Holin-X, holin superfamily III [Geodermatophilus telluris]
MSSPYSGATPVGGSGYPPEPPQANYAVPPTAEQGYAGYEQTPGYEQTSTYEQGSAYEQGYGAHAGERGTPMTEAGRPDVEGASVGQLISEVTTDLSVLMRQELALAKAELTVEAKKAGQGAGAFGAAGFAGYMVLMFLSFALWWALENVMDAGLAALIVAVLWGVIGAVAFVVGRKKFRQVNPKPERTVDTLQQVPGALKPH